MSYRRIALHALLALLLVVSQQQAVVHTLSHAVVEQGKAHGTSDRHYCDQCVAFAGLDNVAASRNPVPPQACDIAEQPEVASIVESECHLRSAYLSRAPPDIS
jgi:hypothetical protein